MKKLLITPLVVVAILMLLPFYSGQKAQTQLDSIVEQINEIPGYSAEWDFYKRDWLESKAVLEISIVAASLEAQANKLTLPVSLDIAHGPVLLNDVTQFGWFSAKTALSEDQSESLAKFLTSSEPGDLAAAKIYMGLLGNTHFSDRVLPFTFNKEEGSGSFSGSAGSGTLSSGGELHYKQLLGEFEFLTREEFAIQVSESELEVDQDYSQAKNLYLVPTKFSWSFDELSAGGEEGSGRIEDIDLSMDMDLPRDKPVINMAVTMSAKSSTIGEEQVDNLNMTFTYDNISIAFYEAYMNMYEKLLADPNQSVPDMSGLTQPKLIDEALSHSPGVSFRELSFTLPEGDFEGDMEFTLSAIPGVPAEQLIQNPMMLISAMLVNANVKADAALVEKLVHAKMETALIQQMEIERQSGGAIEYSQADIQKMANESTKSTLEGVVQQGMLKLDAGKYTSNVVFANSKLLVNGVEIPLGALMQGAMQ